VSRARRLIVIVGVATFALILFAALLQNAGGVFHDDWRHLPLIFADTVLIS
jgi:hypothetical protein